MSAEPSSLPTEQGACSLCGSQLAPGAERCRTCGMVVGVGPAYPNPFTQRALWAMVGGLVAIYAVVLLLVAVLR